MYPVPHTSYLIPRTPYYVPRIPSITPHASHPVSHTPYHTHISGIMCIRFWALWAENTFDMQHFLGSRELHFPFLLYKIGARLLSEARMVQRLLLVSDSKWCLLKGPAHAIRFINKTKFPGGLDCLDKDHHSCSINAALDCWIITEIAWKSPCYIKRIIKT